MKSLNLLYFLIASAFASALLLVTPNGFPYLGLATTFIGAASWAFVGAKNPNIWTKMVAVGIVLLSLMLFVWANPVLTFINIVAILTLGALLVVNPQLAIHHPVQMFAHYASVWAHLWQKTPKFNWQQATSPKTVQSVKSANTYLRLGASIVLTMVIALVLIRVFSSANPIFSYISSWITEKLTTFELRKDLGYWLWRLVMFVIIGIFFNRLGGKTQKPFNPASFVNADFPLLLPKIATALLCTAFIVTHGLMLVNPQAVLSKIGVTHSQTTREIFGQMALASFISLGLITLRRDQKRASNVLSLALLMCVVVLTTIGLQSDYQYIAQFGLTHKRLYGLASVGWLYAVSSLVLYWLNKGGEFVVTRGAVGITIAVLLLINLVNFDGLIATYSPRITQEGTDYSYLAYNLSADAGPMWEHYMEVKKQYLTGDADGNYEPLSAMLYRLPPGKKENYRFYYDGSFNLANYLLYRNAMKLPVEKEIEAFKQMPSQVFKPEDFIPASRSAQIQLVPQP